MSTHTQADADRANGQRSQTNETNREETSGVSITLGSTRRNARIHRSRSGLPISKCGGMRMADDPKVVDADDIINDDVQGFHADGLSLCKRCEWHDLEPHLVAELQRAIGGGQ